MNNKVLRGLVAGVCAGMSGAVFAVDAGGTDKLGEVVVTATKTAKDTMEAPATVSVVTAKEIENRSVLSPDEALTLVPGVYHTRMGGHQPSVMSTNIMLRGIPDYSRTLVVVDGQKLNDPFIGAVNWESVLPETIERIEVVPGPFSALYGGGAMGGVINIITKIPTKAETLVKAGYGTDGLRTGTVLLQGKPFERLGVSFSYGYKASDGYINDDVVVGSSGGAGTVVSGWTQTTDAKGATKYLIGDKGRSPWNSQNVGLKLYADLPYDSKLVFDYTHFSYEKEWDRFNTYLRDAAGNPVSTGAGNQVTFGAGGANAKVAEYLFLAPPNPKIQDRYAFDFTSKLAKDMEFKAQLSYTDISMYDFISLPSAGPTFDGGGPARRLNRPNSEIATSAQLSFPLFDRHFLVTGVSAAKRKIETFQYDNLTDWRDINLTGALTHQTVGEDRTYAIFAQDEIYLTNQLTAYLGARYDSWTTNGVVDGTRFNDRSQGHLSPKASLVYRPADTTTVRGSVGSAFHAPNLRDTFGFWTPTAKKPDNVTVKDYLPNPDLKPETVTSWELGAEHLFATGTLVRATYYDNSLKDLVFRLSTDTSETNVNAGAARVKGIELELRQPLVSGLTAFANATFNRSEITENATQATSVGKRMTNTPQKIFNAGLQGVRGPWSGSMGAHYVGKVYTDAANLDTVNGVYGSYDPYTIVNAKLSYKLKDNVTASLSVDNIFDRQYFQNYHAQGRAFFGEVSARF